MKAKKNFPMIKLILALIAVTFLGFQSRWHYTLSGDIQNYYFPIAQRVFTEQTLIYPPGANLFFLSLPSSSLTTYEWSFVAFNIILTIVLFFLSKRPPIFPLLILAAGPIILFRFDMLIVLLTAFSLVAFQKKRLGLSGLFLGFATVSKVFPVLLFPYLALAVASKKKLGEFTLAFLAAISLVLLAYLLITGLDLQTVSRGLFFNLSKAVHMESVVGTILTIITAFTNPGPHGVDFQNAIWVLSPLYLLGHDRLFRLLVPIGLIFVYGIILLKRHIVKKIDISTCIFLILTILLTSQTFSPQYLIWVTFLYPLTKTKRALTALFLLALVCTQIVYPLNYGELIDFFNLGKNVHLFWILVTRNLLVFILTGYYFYHEILPLLPSKKTHPSF